MRGWGEVRRGLKAKEVLGEGKGGGSHLAPMHTKEVFYFGLYIYLHNKCS